jgi:hypothetical protein
MTDLRTDPGTRDLATYPQVFRARGRKLLGHYRTSVGLAELAANFEDTAGHRAELVRVAQEILRIPVHLMARHQTKRSLCPLDRRREVPRHHREAQSR